MERATALEFINIQTYFMKYLLSFILIAALCSFNLVEDIYSLSVKTIEGKSIDLSNFKGKKMLFIMLPSTATDSSVTAGELSVLLEKYKSELVVIGIPAKETGIENMDEKKQKNLYMNQSYNFVLTESMQVKKEVANQQSSLIQWLTNKDKNKHFDLEVIRAGQKLFVDEAGELYAVMGPETKLSNAAIDKILSKGVMK